MSAIPQDVDFRLSSAASAARFRGAKPTGETTAGSDVSVALYCVGAFDGYSNEEELASLEEEEIAAPLIAAARTLISVSDELRNVNSESLESADGLAMHAAIAFAMHGNFPSARTSVLAADQVYRSLTAARRLAWAVCDPEAIEDIIKLANNDTTEVLFYRSWKKALSYVVENSQTTSEALLKKFSVSPDASDAALMFSTEVAFRQGLRLAIANLRNTVPLLPSSFISRLIDSGRWTLLPPQRKLLADKGLAQSKTNTLLNLPTSTGKTLLAEACLAAALAETSGIAVYVAPYIAIGDQVLTALKSHMPEDIQVVAMFGGFKSEFPSVNPDAKQILVTTPERFDGWLRATADRARLRLVVLDELHCIENGSRGARLEGTVTRLRLLQDSGEDFRLVCLSAVLPEASGLRDWLAVSAGEFHREGWRPTARRLALCRSDGTMTWMYATDALRPPGAQFGTPSAMPVKINLPEAVVPFRGQFVPDRDSVAASRNIAAIAIDLASRLHGPGLIVCPRRIDTRRIAFALSETVKARDESKARLAEVATRVELNHPWLSGLAMMIRSGVAYHNSTLPFEVRRWVEQSVRVGDLRFVASTTTLAEGADLPFRWTLVSHWLSGVYAGAPPINPLTFRNIAGRSGRAGSYSEGDTVLFESLLGPRGAVLDSPQERVAAISKILTDNSPLNSAVISIDGDMEERETKAVVAAFSSQLMAAIPENPTAEDIVAKLSGASYAAQSGSLEKISRLYSSALDEMLDSTAPGGAFATRNSPVALTELGIAANRSGFSPNSVRKLVEFLNIETLSFVPNELVAIALKQFANLPEQSNAYLIKICEKESHRQFLKIADLADVANSWLTSKSPREIFESLPTFTTTKSNSETVETQFEYFVGFIDSVMRSFAPWLLRSMDVLKAFGTESVQNFDWRNLAEKLENREGGPLDSAFE
jgi:helicase